MFSTNSSSDGPTEIPRFRKDREKDIVNRVDKLVKEILATEGGKQC